MVNINKVITIIILLIFLKTDYVEEYKVLYKEYKIPNTKLLIIKYSRMYGVDEILALAICDLESEMNPHMTNPKSSSQGLFGLLSSTHRFIANIEDCPCDIAYRHLTIEQQVYFGVRYIKYLSDKYHKNEKKILNEYCNESGYYKAIQKRKKKYKEMKL